MDDQVLALPAREPVRLRVARAGKIIGMALTQAQCTDALERLGLPVLQGDGVLTVTPPSHRFDLQIEEDLVEEVARMIGYNNLPATPPQAPITARALNEARRSPFAVRHALAGLGYQETINFSFVDERWEHEIAGNPQPVRLLNPMASHLGVMRSSLLGSLVNVLRFNLDRKAQRVRVFELGRVFLRDAGVQDTDTTVQGFDQPMRVAGLTFGDADAVQWGSKSRPVDFFDTKGDVEALLAPLQAQFAAAEHPAMHPGRCARVMVDGLGIGFVGELHPRWCQGYDLPQAPVLFELDLDALLRRRVPLFVAVPRQHAVERDIAVVVAESVTHDALMAAIHEAAGAATGPAIIQGAVLFDVYRPKTSSGAMQTGEKSLGVRLTLQGDDATLTEQHIEAAVSAVVAQLALGLQARQRA